MSDSVFIKRVRLKNYKSIPYCDVMLGPLTFLVGPNGAGKSNFMDALRFVADALTNTLDHALRDRGGQKEVRRRSTGHPTTFAIELEFRLRTGAEGTFKFSVSAEAGGAYSVASEACTIKNANGSESRYMVQKGVITKPPIPQPPAAQSDRLYLVNVSGIPEFRPVYDALASMGFYSLNPERIRDLQSPSPARLLARDGSNITSVLQRISSESRTHIERFLQCIVPDITGVKVKSLGSRETIELSQNVAGAHHPWNFAAQSMSDGTLRALGILVALYQFSGDNSSQAHLVGIEEPEIALHPAAAGVLRDVLKQASNYTQVLVTSHSPDLLDDKDITDESILAVKATPAGTIINEITESSRTTMREQLYTAGELLRLNQLEPAEVRHDAANALSPEDESVDKSDQQELFESDSN